jgi:hypothetical protein
MKKTIQDYKKDAILNKVLRYEEGIMSRRDWLKLWQVKGAEVKEVQEPKVIFNRIKFNRLTGKEQEAYEKSCNEMKIGYRLYISERTSYDINKTEYEHFKALQLEEDINTEKNELSEKIEAGIATDEEINEAMQKEFEFAAKYF